MKFIEKYKKKLIVASISVGIALQLGGAYGGYVVYSKIKKIERQERVLKAKLKRIVSVNKQIKSTFGQIAVILEYHAASLSEVLPKVNQLEKKLRKLERQWK